MRAKLEHVSGLLLLALVAAGTATFRHPNDQRATTLWYDDHGLGMARLNVYAGPPGFYVLRDGPDDGITVSLPRPAPALSHSAGVKYSRILTVIHGRSFKADGSLLYPGDRAFGEGAETGEMDSPARGPDRSHGHDRCRRGL